MSETQQRKPPALRTLRILPLAAAAALVVAAAPAMALSAIDLPLDTCRITAGYQGIEVELECESEEGCSAEVVYDPESGTVVARCETDSQAQTYVD